MTEQVDPGIAAAGYDEAEPVYLDLLRRERHADLGDAASKVAAAAKL